MELSSDSFEDGARIPEEFAFGKHDPAEHFTLAGNRSPHLAWSGAPEGTASLAVVCVDGDAPTDGTNVNKEGVTVPHDLPRADFHHWALIDLDPATSGLEAGAHSDGVTPGGKGPEAPAGRHGTNDYTSWFAGDPDMGGTYHGYDGPAPPWNDERIHHYRFTVYALDVATLDVADGFGAPDALAAMEGHVLAEASITGAYAINPDGR